MNHHSVLSSNSKPTPYWQKKNYNKQQILHPKMIVDSLNGNVNDRVKTTTKNVWLIFTVTSMNLMKNNDSNSCLYRTFLSFSFFFILFIACHQCKCRHKQMLGCFYYRIIYTACKRNRNNTHKYLGMKKYIKHSNAKISNHIHSFTCNETKLNNQYAKCHLLASVIVTIIIFMQIYASNSAIFLFNLTPLCVIVHFHMAGHMKQNHSAWCFRSRACVCVYVPL